MFYSSKTKKNIEVAVFILIIVVAIFFRFSNITETPPGLWVDEAMNGTDVLNVLDGQSPKIFYPDNNGREGLFIYLQSISVNLVGPYPYSLRVVSAIIGVLTVIGLYFLTKEMFSWEIAAISSFLMAVSFWHVNFSRIGFRAIMLPFILVFTIYFLLRGLKTFRWGDFVVSGIFAGLGFYTYISYRVAPIIFMALVMNYWLFLKKKFEATQFRIARHKFMEGLIISGLVALIISLPMVFLLVSKPDLVANRQTQLSVLGSENPLADLTVSTIKTLAMFNFNGDWNQRHNLPGQPMLIWPVGIFFLIGFIRELRHWLKRKNGYFSPIHTLLFSWFFVMLLPGFLSFEAPHALRTIGVIPVVMIFSALGLHWSMERLLSWYGLHEPSYQYNRVSFLHQAKNIKIITLVIFLSAVALAEHNRYFEVWAKSPATKFAFTQHLTSIADHLKSQDRDAPTYILVNENGVLVDGVSVFAQPIKFITKTHTQESAQEENIYYISGEQLKSFKFPKTFSVIPLVTDEDTVKFLKNNLKLKEKKYESFSVYSK